MELGAEAIDGRNVLMEDMINKGKLMLPRNLEPKIRRGGVRQVNVMLGMRDARKTTAKANCEEDAISTGG